MKHAKNDHPPIHIRWSLAWTVACLYLPFAWVVLMDYPWNSYHWHWVSMWPVLPGFFAGIPFHPNDRAMMLAMGAATVVLVGLGTFFGRRSAVWTIAVTFVLLGISIFSSFVAYAVFRA